MRFIKSGGLTPSEKVLAAVCENSFLSLWSYPNLYRKPAKELCDLLVVFGDDVVLFSDKSCGYPQTGDTQLDWERWYRRSVTDSAKQLRRAEQWIRTQPERVFLDARCTIKLPLALPPRDRLRVHRVCIALGSSARAFAETGKPALTVSALSGGGTDRFTIEPVPVTGAVVHVFDDVTLQAVLAELSTASDFLDYLTKKEALLESGLFAHAESELDLLAYYLGNNRTCPTHGPDRFRVEANLWQVVQADAGFQRGKTEDRASYFWDGLVEYLTRLFLAEKLEVGNDMTVSDYEIAVRVMAGETRFSRRLLSKWILERAAVQGSYVGSLFPSVQQRDVLYVLLIGPGDGGGDHARYRKARAEQLHARCLAAKVTQPDRNTIVGLALDARGVKGRSEDFIYMNTAAWTLEQFAIAQEVRETLGYFVDGKAKQTKIDEYEYPGIPG